jgi:FMN phosphatase YigB (HAD superfamily)
MEKIVFLFDVDNTLLDNDRVSKDLRTFLAKEVGEQRNNHYWEIFEQLRSELGYADYLGALQRYRVENPYDSHLLALSNYLINYPFANRLFPNSLDVLEYCGQFGQVVILTDGDVVFQPRKIERSGLFEAVAGNILIYVHKEQELHDVERRYPATHYVLVDDKIRILTAIKKIWGAKVTTVFPKQGHYALDEKEIAKYPKADISIERVGDLLGYNAEQLITKAVRNRQVDIIPVIADSPKLDD